MFIKNQLKNKLVVLTLSLIFLGTFGVGYAESSNDIDFIKSELAKRMPPILVKSIAPTPLEGIYEIYVGSNIFYIDKTTKYVFAGGSLLDDNTKTNLTSNRLKELTRINFNDLPLQNAIEIKKGTGNYKFAVFTDPDCPYCKSLEQNLAKSDLGDYTAYVFLYPLTELHPDAFAKAESIWCAKDKAKAWLNWMVKGNSPTKLNCDNPLLENQKLANDLGVAGTPTIYLQNGEQSQSIQELAADIKAKKY